MAKKLTTEDFIKKAKLTHKEEYDYSKSLYKGTFNELNIICRNHGQFTQRPNNHLNGQGCPECGRLKTTNKQKTTKKNFIIKSIKVHKNSYDYSKVEYVNNKTGVKIICKKHGEFKQTPDNHINKKSGCSKCAGNSNLTNYEFIKIAKEIHGDKYKYTLVDYKNSKSKIKITCPLHGEFECRASHHSSGTGCPKCSTKHSHSTEEFIEIANNVHGNKYDYHKSNYINSKNKITITCKKHGEFKQNASSHINNSRGCSICVESVGEINVRKFLTKNSIEFVSQKKFKDCINIDTNRKLSFDFYLPKHNICIEYQGKQHFVPVKKWGGKNNLEKIKKRDEIKRIYCKKNNIILLEIKYSENIDDILKNKIK